MRFEDRGFPSVRELLDYHVQTKIYVTKKSQAILVNPVLKEKDKWEMRREDIILKDKLGQGHFGDVMKGILKPSNLPVAVKSCKESVSESVKKKFLAEAEILKQYDHPNIVKLIGVCADREPVFIGKLINGYPTRNNNSLVAAVLVTQYLQSWTKVLEHLHFWAFSNSHRSNLSPHPTNNVGRVYPEFSPSFNFVQGGGRENGRKISKRMRCFMREPRMTKK